MKWLIAMLGLCFLISTAHADNMGLDEIEALGRLNGKALACSQKDNISRIKAVMINLSPKTRYYGATFESATSESFLARSVEQDACVDAPIIALQVEDLATRLRAMFPVGEKR